MDPSGDGTPWVEMFNLFDDDPRDNKISREEFRYLYDNFACSHESFDEMFNRLDLNSNGVLTHSEFKPAWEHYRGWAC